MTDIQRRIRRSKFWNCYEVIDEDNKKARCNLCNHLISYKSTTNNLKVHLIRKHERAYNIIMNTENTETTKVLDNEIVEEYLDTDETNADSDHVSNSSGDDPLERNKNSYKTVESKDGEKWFVQFNSHPDKKPTARKFADGSNKVGKKKSAVLRQLEIMVQDREKTTNIQMEVCNLQKEKEKLIMEQNTKEHELRCSILQLEYEYKKEQLAMLRKENGNQ